MIDEGEFVEAYDKRTGKKLPHLVPAHFVNELAGVTNLSATPRGKKAAAVTAETSTEKEK